MLSGQSPLLIWQTVDANGHSLVTAVMPYILLWPNNGLGMPSYLLPCTSLLSIFFLEFIEQKNGDIFRFKYFHFAHKGIEMFLAYVFQSVQYSRCSSVMAKPNG